MPTRVAVLGLGTVLGGLVVLAILGRSVPPPAEQPATPAPSEAIATASPTPSPSVGLPVVRMDPCETATIAPLRAAVTRHPRDLESGLLSVVVDAHGADYQVVTDGRYVWSYQPGRLTRTEVQTGAQRHWTPADDPAFGAANGIRAARDGGVWLVGSSELRWFDGDRFRDVIEGPTWEWNGVNSGGLADMSEATDGSVWASLWDAGPIHWDGVTWTALCQTGVDHGASNVVVAMDGTVWVAYNSPGTLARYDSTGRQLVAVAVPGMDRNGIQAMAVAGDGAVWVSTYDALDRFDGRWTSESAGPGDLPGTSSLAAAPDGTIWAAAGTPNGTSDGEQGAGVIHFGTPIPRTFGATAGLPTIEAAGSQISSIAVDAGGAYVATPVGMYALRLDPAPDSATWAALGPRVTPGPALNGSNRLVASRTGEFWVMAGDGGLGHLQDGAWREESIPGFALDKGYVADLVGGPAGAIAVATNQGAMVRSGGRWTIVAKGLTSGVAFDRDGSVWVASGGQDRSTGDAPQDPGLSRYRPSVSGWARTQIDLPPGLTAISAIVTGGAGDVWMRGLDGEVDSVWHRVDGRWTPSDRVLGAVNPPDRSRLVIAADGSLWTSIGYDDSPAIVAIRRVASVWTKVSTGGQDPTYGTVDLVQGPDRTMWASADGIGLVHIGDAGTEAQLSGWFGGIAIGPDRRVYVVGPSGIYRVEF
ncbi:MAG: hypothetical protein ACHQ3P_00455 [Candidatus Limnocylindrales bacterium]